MGVVTYMEIYSINVHYLNNMVEFVIISYTCMPHTSVKFMPPLPKLVVPLLALISYLFSVNSYSKFILVLDLESPQEKIHDT